MTFDLILRYRYTTVVVLLGSLGNLQYPLVSDTGLLTMRLSVEVLQGLEHAILLTTLWRYTQTAL